MASRDELIRLLILARKFNNQTVNDANLIDQWHKEVDAALLGEVDDLSVDRYDDPARKEHREFVNSVFFN
jgi:hypothetical protein